MKDSLLRNLGGRKYKDSARDRKRKVSKKRSRNYSHSMIARCGLLMVVGSKANKIRRKRK